MNQNVGVISHFEYAYECIIICHPSALGFSEDMYKSLISALEHIM